VALVACGSATDLGGGSGASAEPSSVYFPSLSGVTALSSSGLNQATCALVAAGTVSCWGPNETGVDGYPPDKQCFAVPHEVSGLDDVLLVAAGGGFACAVLADSSVQCWGSNDYGELGVSPSVPTETPKQIAGVTGATYLATGSNTACAVMMDGTSMCWGGSSSGAPTPQPFLLPVTNASQLAVGERSILCARINDGSVQCSDIEGQPYQFAPVPGISNAIDLSAGTYQACAVTSDGHVSCWGQNNFGELGVADQTATGPVVVPGVEDAVEVRASYEYTCAVTASGQVFCWGDNSYSTLGTSDLPGSYPCAPSPKEGDLDVCSPPIQVPGIENAIHIAAADDHVCALLADGTVECWGDASSCP
jgi:alpha-tubulin suppressor-like RCC1 family protein